jgi:hypothetical protein
LNPPRFIYTAADVAFYVALATLKASMKAATR